MSDQETQKIHQYVGEMYIQLRMMKEFYECELQKKDMLAEQLKGQIFQLQKGAAGGTMGT